MSRNVQNEVFTKPDCVSRVFYMQVYTVYYFILRQKEIKETRGENCYKNDSPDESSIVSIDTSAHLLSRSFFQIQKI